jgi:hypothetical protein
MGDLKTHGTASDWSMCNFSHQISWSSHQAEAFEMQPYISMYTLQNQECWVCLYQSNFIPKHR